MAMQNKDIADQFSKLATLLEIEGANPFRVRAYRNAARIIGGLGTNVATLIAKGEDLQTLPGIGKDLAEKITTLVETRQLPLLQELEARLPPILITLSHIEGLGPKRIQQIYQQLHIKDERDLLKAIDDGRLQRLAGFGEKIAAAIRQGLVQRQLQDSRMLLADAEKIALALLAYLQSSRDIIQLQCAGSYRRRQATVGDLDILVTTEKSDKIIQRFVAYEEVARVLSHGTTRSTVILHNGTQVDLRVVPENSYGAALLYFTGSKAHNIALRQLAQKKKLKLNEYGLFKGTRCLAGRTEAQMYKQLGLSYIDPELREDRGEISAAQHDDLPELIQLKQVRGDLHCHTNASDGSATLEVMVESAQAAGYHYLAITDHSARLRIANGLDKKRLRQQLRAIDKLNARLKNFVILKSAEIDILADGKLDIEDELLAELDLTVCAIHSHFHLSEKKQTERIIRAMDNPYFNILAHPTCRLINKRAPINVDMNKILEAAQVRGCALEINAQPLRMDIDDIYCRAAKDAGVKLVLSTDAHSPAQLDYMRFGVDQARRGWLTKQDVLNTRPLKTFLKLLRRR